MIAGARSRSGSLALAHLRVYGDPDAARELLGPMAHQLAETLRAWVTIEAAGPSRPASPPPRPRRSSGRSAR